MSLKQCSACAATVDAAKAFCPDCGAPMEEELKRHGASEFDSMVRTQNVNRTMQLRLLEEFDLSGFTSRKEVNEPKSFDDAVKTSAALNAPPANHHIQPKPETVVLKPENSFPAESKKPEIAAKSNKNLYLSIVAGLVFLFLAFIAAIGIGVLIWNYSK